MEMVDYYDLIFKRKSFKRYNLTPVDEDQLIDISKQLNNLKPLYEDIKTEVKILPLKMFVLRRKRNGHLIIWQCFQKLTMVTLLI